MRPDHAAAFNARAKWFKTARYEQIPRFDPITSIWLYLAGRGAGKTRSTGEESWWECVNNPGIRWAVITPTYADLTRITFEGESGFKYTIPPEVLLGDKFETAYNKTAQKLTFKNGSIIQGYSSESPDRLRGPQHHGATCEELAAWVNMQETWDMLRMGLRLGLHPKTLIATTPRPVPLLKQLVARDDVVVVRGSTWDNKANLAPSFLKELEKRYAGTRLGRQELEAEILEDTPGALWQRDMLQYAEVLPDLVEVVVAVDPPVTADGDECGIIVAGIDEYENGYVLEDISMGGLSPERWASRVIKAYKRWDADRVVAEINQGGDMVESVIRSVDSNVSYTSVRAKRGKFTRAEPVAALYEKKRIFHHCRSNKLEDQMCNFTVDGTSVGYDSPDRVDALVWAFSHLIIKNQTSHLITPDPDKSPRHN